MSNKRLAAMVFLYRQAQECFGPEVKFRNDADDTDLLEFALLENWTVAKFRQELDSAIAMLPPTMSRTWWYMHQNLALAAAERDGVSLSAADEAAPHTAAGTVEARAKADRSHALTGPIRLEAARRCRIHGDAGKGRLPTFTGIAYTGNPMRLEGWYELVIIDLAGVSVSQQHRPALWQHDHGSVLGHTTTVNVTGEAIKISGVFSGHPDDVQKVTVPAKNGFRWQLSIGANPVRTEFLDAGESTEVNGREITGPMVIVRETELGEVSFVPLGADQDTSATVTASLAV